MVPETYTVRDTIRDPSVTTRSFYSTDEVLRIGIVSLGFFYIFISNENGLIDLLHVVVVGGSRTGPCLENCGKDFLKSESNIYLYIHISVSLNFLVDHGDGDRVSTHVTVCLGTPLNGTSVPNNPGVYLNSYIRVGVCSTFTHRIV